MYIQESLSAGWRDESNLNNDFGISLSKYIRIRNPERLTSLSLCYIHSLHYEHSKALFLRFNAMNHSTVEYGTEKKEKRTWHWNGVDMCYWCKIHFIFAETYI